MNVAYKSDRCCGEGCKKGLPNAAMNRKKGTD